MGIFSKESCAREQGTDTEPGTFYIAFAVRSGGTFETVSESAGVQVFFKVAVR
jgi:hypothetical protein